jgi:hypothetical protein
MPNNQGKTTNVVSITVSLNSSTAAAAPYYASSCTGTVTFTGNPPPPPESFDNWATEDIGTPPTGGASLNLTVVDQGYSSNATSVAGWTLAFLPRAATTQSSPLTSNNMSGGTVTSSTGEFPLISSTSNGNNVIRAHGSSQQEWDWSLMVQMKMPDGSIKSFVSDPEMQMDN